MSKVYILLMVKTISILADDTSFILDGSEQSLQSSLKILLDFAKISGLRINYNKTQVVWKGCKKKHCDDIICTNEALEGASKLLNYLAKTLLQICKISLIWILD